MLPILKPARLSRRDFLLGSGVLGVLAAAAGLRRVPEDHPATALDDFMLVSQILSAVPLNRTTGLVFYSALLQRDPRFADNVQTLAWLVRRHQQLDAVGLIGLLEAGDQHELRATLGSMIDVWSTQLGGTPAFAEARARIELAGAGQFSSS